MHEDGSGYDLSDPKHPDYAERHFERADRDRKLLRENGGIGGAEKGSGIPGVAAVRDGGISVAGVAAHEHEWGEWSSTLADTGSHGYERRFCICGAFQSRVRDA